MAAFITLSANTTGTSTCRNTRSSISGRRIAGRRALALMSVWWMKESKQLSSGRTFWARRTSTEAKKRKVILSSSTHASSSVMSLRTRGGSSEQRLRGAAAELKHSLTCTTGTQSSPGPTQTPAGRVHTRTEVTVRKWAVECLIGKMWFRDRGTSATDASTFEGTFRSSHGW